MMECTHRLCLKFSKNLEEHCCTIHSTTIGEETERTTTLAILLHFIPGPILWFYFFYQFLGSSSDICLFLGTYLLFSFIIDSLGAVLKGITPYITKA